MPRGLKPVTESLALPSEATTLALLRAAVETLLRRAFAQPRMQGRRAGAATLRCALRWRASRSWR